MTGAPVLAIDLGGTGIKGEVLAPGLDPVVAGRRTTPRGAPEKILDEVAALAVELLDGLPAGGRPERLGLAIPGIIDPASGTGVLSTTLGWRDVPVAAMVAERTGLPVVVTHDVTAAGFAEHRIGAGRGADDVLVVVLGTGISAAVVSGGRIVTGGRGQAGELGHVVVRPGGPACTCGRRGCLEAIASAAAITRRYTDLSGRPATGALDVRQRLGTDGFADGVWCEAISALADALVTALALLAMDRIVIGGGLAEAGAALLDPLRDAVSRRCTVEPVPEIVAAALGARAGLIGAALAAWDPTAQGAVICPP